MRYESHVTFRPLGGRISSSLKRFLSSSGWRLSRFEEDEVDGAAQPGIWFLTRKADDLVDLISAVETDVRIMRENYGSTIIRYKIEATLIDSKDGDSLCAL